MEALKKAEQAKRKATEGSVTASPAPAAPSTLALELTPADHKLPKPETTPINAAPPSNAAPALTAAAFTLMTGRLTEAGPPATSPSADIPAVPRQVEPAPLPAPEPQLQSPRITLKQEPGLDNKMRAAAPAPAARRMPPRRRIPILWVGGGVALVFTLIGSGYWYYNSMAQYLTQQASLGAPQTALAPLASEAASPIPAVAPATMTASPPRSAALNTTPHAINKIKPASKPPASVTAPTVAQSTLATVAVPAPVTAVPGSVSLVVSTIAASVPVPPPAPLSVSRDAEQNDLFVALQAAYRAYQSGDDSNAQKLYARVLSRDEHNRDALLGIAAVAVRQKDFVRAQEIYSELLTLDPKDSVAQAGFVSVTGSFDPLQQEARIKALLEQEPGAPHLLFTYASFLMQQQRWLEATRTLQSAVQAQRDNADYAYNLAVSFDHLGQRDAAVKHYRAALELAAKQSTSFRPDDVRRRLKAMSAPDSGGSAP